MRFTFLPGVTQRLGGAMRCLGASAIGAGFVFFSQHSRADNTVAQPYIWKSVAINGGGFVAGIVTDPNAAGLMYARTDVGGAYRWDAKRKMWTALTDWISQSDGNLLGCESIAIDPSDSKRLYLALGLYTNSWGGNGAIARSGDGGKTFARTNVPFKMGGNCPGRSCGERLAVDPNDGRVLFFGSRAAGLWKSIDGAKTWHQVKTFPAVATSSAAMDQGSDEWALGISFVKFDRASGKAGSPTPVLYAGVCTQQTSLFRSSDGGTTWAAVPGQPAGLRPNHLAVTPDDSCYISYGDQCGPNGMSDGAIWALNPRTDQWIDVTPVKPSESDHFGYGAVTVDPRRPGTLMACSLDRWGHGDTVFRTIDGGRHWTNQVVGASGFKPSLFSAPGAPWAMSMGPHWLGDIEIDPFDSDHVLFVTGYGIWASHDATALDTGKPLHWIFEDRGLEETVPEELISPPAGPHLVSVIGDFDGFTHDDLDVSPARGRHAPPIGSTSGLDFAGNAPNLVVRAGGNGKGFISRDGGETWTEFASTPPHARTGGEIAISSDGQTILWECGASATYQSGDQGNSWVPCQGLPRPARPVADKVDPSLFYCMDSESGQLYVSTDAGRDFSAAAGDLPRHDGNLRAMPRHRGDVWLASDGRLLHSTDGGHTFARVTSVSKADKIGFGKAAPGTGYPTIFMVGKVGQTEGVFRSDDAGQSWTRINDDQHSYGYLDVVIGDPRVYGRVYLGTSGRGIVYGDLANQPR